MASVTGPIPVQPNPIITLIRELAALPHETEWVEFKLNKAEPEEIGEYLSALSNSAALVDQPRGYIVWGVTDDDHSLAGTTFRPRQTKVGNEELENWLTRQLHPSLHFLIHEVEEGGKRFVLFDIPAALHTPVRFRDFEYVRVGSIKQRLRDHPEKERALWAKLNQIPFEEGIARDGASGDDVLQLIDYPAYFQLTGQPLADRAGVLDRLEQERFIVRRAQQYDITNLGAMLFARDLREFPALAGKSVRFVIYKENSRLETVREQEEQRGYAAGFIGFIEFINSRLPRNELIEQALRREVRLYPELAVRELVANGLIHQDFGMGGTHPMVELFVDRLEITNPGRPLIAPDRFLGAVPRSRNEALASFMRRIGICEERGSGIVKVITHVEFNQLPAPDFQVIDQHTRAVLFAPKTLANMDRADRIRACYQHGGLQWVSNRQMTNASLRARFGIDEQNAAQASRIIAETLEAGLIKVYDPASKSKRHIRYVPFWA